MENKKRAAPVVSPSQINSLLLVSEGDFWWLSKWIRKCIDISFTARWCLVICVSVNAFCSWCERWMISNDTRHILVWYFLNIFNVRLLHYLLRFCATQMKGAPGSNSVLKLVNNNQTGYSCTALIFCGLTRACSETTFGFCGSVSRCLWTFSMTILRPVDVWN